MLLNKLTHLVIPARRPPRECEACGQPFQCGASLKGCWCFGIELDAEARERLRTKYKDCLCQECLRRFAGEEHKHAS